MERYTKKHYDEKGHYLICSGACETLNCGDCGILDKIVDRLAAYEDTGLTPEEVQKMQWIPVEERLPEPTENPVLVHDYSGVSVAWHSQAMGWVYKTGFACVDVTHWMPLPQPPKEEKHEKNTNTI